LPTDSWTSCFKATNSNYWLRKNIATMTKFGLFIGGVSTAVNAICEQYTCRDLP